MEDEEWDKLSVEDRVGHKLWKARVSISISSSATVNCDLLQVSGYEEARKQFGTWEEDDPRWKNYLGLAKKMLADTNAVAQIPGMECCLEFAENCKVIKQV